MKITIDATPAELAELIFALVDCDVEVDDDGEDEDDEPEGLIDDDDDEKIILAEMVIPCDRAIGKKHLRTMLGSLKKTTS